MNKFTTLLLDADNTLLDFDKDEYQALVKALEHYSVPATKENTDLY